MKIQTLHLVKSTSDPQNLSQRNIGNNQVPSDMLNSSKNEGFAIKNKRKDNDSPNSDMRLSPNSARSKR